MLRRFHISLIVFLVLLTSCSPRRSSVSLSGGGGGSTLGRIYVSNAANNSIVRFDSALTVTGNVAPGAIIAGGSTQLAAPQYMLLDVPNNRLFVANKGASSVLIFETVNTKTGNVAPERTIAGAATLLVAPVDLALDSGRDLLYVADGSNILVFAGASNTNGNVPPVRIIGAGFTVDALFLDRANDRLFAADATGNAIHVYDGASLLNNAVVANRIISGGSTQLNQPAGLQVDNAGRLIVSNFGTPSITIYFSAAIGNGNITPAATIAGSNTGLGAPTQMILNNATTTGDLHIADGKSASVLVFANIGAANGNIAPTRNISGSNTGLARSGGGTGPFTANGIALDTTR
jgi:hypothetical protein